MILPPASLSDARRAHKLEHHRAVLQELTEIGGAIANAIHGCATAPTCSRASLIELAAAFELVTNSMCSNILLGQDLAKPPATHPGRAAAARKRILYEVERAIRRQTSGAEADGLCAAVLDHLEIVECAGSLERRPVSEIIRAICRDLGVAGRAGDRPSKRRKPAGLATLSELAAHLPETCRPTAASKGSATPASTRAMPRLIHDSSAPSGGNS